MVATQGPQSRVLGALMWNVIDTRLLVLFAWGHHLGWVPFSATKSFVENLGELIDTNLN